MNNEYLHMQKLAGLITEGEYQAKMDEGKLSREEYHNIQRYMDNAGYRSSEGMDDTSYYINGDDFVMGIDDHGYYVLDDKTNEQFTSLADVIKFYNERSEDDNSF
jgi:hypothetical protein